MVLTAGPAAAEPIIGLTTAGTLVPFDSANPGAGSTVPLSGLGGTTLVGIDIRPANNTLYGLGQNGQLFTINPNTGLASAVGAPVALPAGSSFGFDFNPVVDLIRVTSDAGSNLRLNPNTGALAGTDTSLSFDMSTGAPGTPAGGATAYTNNDTDPATPTRQFTIDTTLGRLFVQGFANPPGPNGGVLTNPPGFGPVVSPAFLGSGLSFDIPGTERTGFVINGNSIFAVNLDTFAVTPFGTVIPEPSTLALFGLGAAALAVARRRQA